MRHFDVFNGDADGICALHQLRLERPADATLVTGLKRDIALLDSVDAAAGDTVTVLDLSLDRNRAALLRLLARGVSVQYFDHHEAAPIPPHEGLTAVIDTEPGTCTSVIVDRFLHGRFRPWAVVGAFGDNQSGTAIGLARSLGLDAKRVAILRELGEDLNYNAYGDSESDVMIAPAELYRLVRGHADPFDFAVREPLVLKLREERQADLARALATHPVRESVGADAWVLPDAAWARRVSGTFANHLAHEEPERAHAVLAPDPAGGYTVSVRSPRSGKARACDLCGRFGGGGRAIAAGIDGLAADRLVAFMDAFEDEWGRSAPV
ncbi:MAG TPA: acetyltransferase [Usitatibacter sp.]|nr:acetyltransferase [Usitatibacter sp.]